MTALDALLLHPATAGCCDWLAVFLTTSLVFLLLHAIYDVFFHPLSRHPGPFFAKISKIPNFYHAMKGDRHIWIWQNHQIYGEKVRIQPNAVLFLSAQAYRDIYGSKANVRRAKVYEGWKTVPEANTILTIDPETHARKRKTLNQAFTEKSLKHAAKCVSQHTDRWIDLLIADNNDQNSEGWSKTRNMSDWNNWLVFDILGDMCFGRSFDIKEPKPNPIRIVPNLVISHVQMIYPILQSPFMEFYVWVKPRGLDYLFNMMAPEEIRAYYKFINDSVSNRIRMEKESSDEENSRLDMFHFLCAAKDPVTGEGYSEVALRGEAVLLIVAGSDTTSSTLSGFWFYISRNVNAYQRLTSEIRSIFELCDEIKIGSKLSSCTYLYACIDEALRITPSGPSDFPREVLSGGTNIDGEHFPEGTIVGCSHWSMSRNEHIYGDPNRFRPERYIPSEATGVTVEQVNELKSYYQPFLIGPTNCAGKNIAMTELAIIIAKNLFALDVRSVPGEDLGAGHPSQGWGKRDKNQYQIVDAYITVHEGPMVQFRKRSV